MPRKKCHRAYQSVLGYQKISGHTDEEVAKALGYCIRTYKDKVYGYSDFSVRDAEILSALFGVSKDALFFIRDVSSQQ